MTDFEPAITINAPAALQMLPVDVLSANAVRVIAMARDLQVSTDSTAEKTKALNELVRKVQPVAEELGMGAEWASVGASTRPSVCMTAAEDVLAVLLDELTPISAELIALDVAIGDLWPEKIKSSGSRYLDIDAGLRMVLPEMTADDVKKLERAFVKHRARLGRASQDPRVRVAVGLGSTVAIPFLVPALGGAIGSAMGLSGAAATSAGLAALGGGSLASGGLGMAGGALLIKTTMRGSVEAGHHIVTRLAGSSVETVVELTARLDMGYRILQAHGSEACDSLLKELGDVVDEISEDIGELDKLGDDELVDPTTGVPVDEGGVPAEELGKRLRAARRVIREEVQALEESNLTIAARWLNRGRRLMRPKEIIDVLS